MLCISACCVLVHVVYQCMLCISACCVSVHVVYQCMLCISACCMLCFVSVFSLKLNGMERAEQLIVGCQEQRIVCRENPIPGHRGLHSAAGEYLWESVA
jgi:hypothetical protein